MSRFLIRQLTEKKSPSAGTELVKFESSTAHNKSSKEGGKQALETGGEAGADFYPSADGEKILHRRVLNL